ncbi:hypothetical protein EYF80_045673 [Liparis tanakae]|uniref:Uncharacterized protein n=1 Tax=Liparis tanakae TaxID=230148 RepID=A0A4Z2FUW7_9TELE|nr:hypothetical protein EYF80_045673 [Liparis tanakae]
MADDLEWGPVSAAAWAVLGTRFLERLSSRVIWLWTLLASDAFCAVSVFSVSTVSADRSCRWPIWESSVCRERFMKLTLLPTSFSCRHMVSTLEMTRRKARLPTATEEGVDVAEEDERGREHRLLVHIFTK